MKGLDLKNLFYVLLTSLLFLFPITVSAADFTFADDTIIMSGEIQNYDYENKFLPLATNHIGQVKFLYLAGSPGGAFADSLEIGMYVHDANIAAVVGQPCYSGCAFIWLGAKTRLYDLDKDANPVVGIHMPYSIDWAHRVWQADDQMKRIVKMYLEKTAALPPAAVKMIMATPGGPTTNLNIDGQLAMDWNLGALPYGR